MTRDRRILAQLLKNWAQDHNHGFQINDPDPTDQGLRNTGGYLTWLIQENKSDLGGLDLIDLLDRLESFLENKRARKFPDGMFCRKCRIFYEFAESNQSDGTLLCYTCRQNPYG
jgi:hypothetical protein